MRNAGFALVPLVLAIAGSLAFVQRFPQSDQTLTGSAAYGDWRSDRPGIRRRIGIDDMPAPMATEAATSLPIVVKRPDEASPKVPPGFTAELFVSGLTGPRVVRTAPNGDIFVAETEANRVRAIRVSNGEAKPSELSVFASGLDSPFGIAFYPPGPAPRYVYVATTTQVVRFPYRSGDLKASGSAEIIVRSLPGGGHSTRDVAFSPDGKRMFVSVGSQSNVAKRLPLLTASELEIFEKTHGVGAVWGDETDRADVLTFDPEGHEKRAHATGLRNCCGVTIQPATGELWCVVNERNLLGDDLPPDFVTRVKAGGFYGWPWY